MSENKRKACQEWCGGRREPNASCIVGVDARYYCCSPCCRAGRPLSPQIKSGTDALVKPTKVEVGQRWQLRRDCEGHKAGEVVTVSEASPCGRWHLGRFDNCSERGHMSHGLTLFLGIAEDRDGEYADATYLGTSPEVKPAEEAKAIAACPPPPKPGEPRDPPWIKKPTPNVTRPICREVWAGGQWLDYAYLGNSETSPEPFESYLPRRLVSNEPIGLGGKYADPARERVEVRWLDDTLATSTGQTMTWLPARKPAPGPALTTGDLAGAAAAALVSR